MRNVITAVFVIFMLLSMTDQLFAEDPNLSIYDIQYTENEDGSSYYDGNTVDCLGGVVIHKYLGSRHKLVLYDPNNWDGWGGISVKGDFNTNPMPFNNVNLGDWIYLDDVLVDESGKARENTDLIFKSTSSYSKISIGNSLPEPLVVEVNDIAVVYDPELLTCLVADHRAEKYEAMYIQVRNVVVGDYTNAGSHRDNYSLYEIDDPNIYCWAADYMNNDNPDPDTPLPIVISGLELCSVSGILEQYTKLPDWDYYQLLTTEEEDFQIEQTADFDDDCDVDFLDFSLFAQHWLQEGCTEPDWCGGADLVHDANVVVDMLDLMEFTRNWLEGKY